MEEVKMDYGEAEKILQKRLRPMARSLGEQLGKNKNYPLSAENFQIDIAPTVSHWAGQSDYSKVNLAIETTEYPKIRRRVNGIETKGGDLKDLKDKIKEIIAESKRTRAKKESEAKEQKDKCKALMLKFKEFNPRNEGWGITIRSRKLRFEINAYRDEVEVYFSGKTDEIADVLRRLG
jgi:hypothetical protein